MNAEIVAIGTELLLGQIVDTNAVYLAEQLNRIGVSVIYKTTVGDNPGRMREVLSRALERADLVITSGGLGPTEDDLTREIAAEVTGRKLVLQEKLLAQIQQIFTERNLPFSENNKRQAYLPEGAIPIENSQGTAPCYIIESDRGILLSLPGVPREMKYLMQQAVLPYLKERLGETQLIKYRVLKLCGTGESLVDHAISDLISSSTNPTIGLLAHLGQIDIRITAKAENEQQANHLIATLEQKIRDRLPHQIFGADEDSQESVIVDLLRKNGLSLAIAESNTGGYVAQQFIAFPDIAQVFRGAVVATDSESLGRLLAFSESENAEHGLLNMEVAKQMARHVKDLCGAEVGLGVTGYCQSQDAKIVDPAVPVYIALHNADGSFTTKEYRLSGPSNLIKTRVKNMALELLRREILQIKDFFGD